LDHGKRVLRVINEKFVDQPKPELALELSEWLPPVKKSGEKSMFLEPRNPIGSGSVSKEDSSGFDAA
jgi:hypothetical protein